MGQTAAAIAAYEAALEAVDTETLADTPEETLGLLLARDAVQAALAEQSADAGLVIRLQTADDQLRALHGALSSLAAIDAWRETVGPSEGAWWWEPVSELELSAAVGWRGAALNLLTILFLALATSFTVGIFQALSSDGISWAETFGTLVQASGLALVGSGTLTQKGRRRVAQLLSRWGLAQELQASMMCAAAAALAATLWAAHDRVLPDWFEHAGEQAYHDGELRNAEAHFRRALALGQEPARVLIYLGRIRETLEDHEAAGAHYEQALLAGDPHAFNYLGRLLLSSPEPDPSRAKALLQLGLQRAIASKSGTATATDSSQIALEMDLRRNLAWALMLELRSGGHAPSDAPDRITKLLGQVNELQAQLGNDAQDAALLIDQDMEDCLLAHHLTLLGQPTEAQKHRTVCMEGVRPETIGEYRFLLDTLIPDCPLTIDTSAVIRMGS
jgi:tetratricopeptide (TPR) repeat protein